VSIQYGSLAIKVMKKIASWMKNELVDTRHWSKIWPTNRLKVVKTCIGTSGSCSDDKTGVIHTAGRMYRKDRNDVHGRPAMDLFKNFYTYGRPYA